MHSFTKLSLSFALGATLLVAQPGAANAATLPELRSNVVTLIATRLSQLQVEREAALAKSVDPNLPVAERLAAAEDYKSICARQYKLEAQEQRIGFLPKSKLLTLEAYLADLVSPS